MTTAQNDDRGGWLIAAALLAQLAACYGVVYKTSGRLLGGEGFKGVLAGTLGAGFVLVLLGAAVLAATEKASAAAKTRYSRLGAAALLLAALGFSWAVALPVLRHDPETYYYGSATASYAVTYGDGRTETKSGAELGVEKWEWAVAWRLSAALVLWAAGLYRLARRAEPPAA